MLMMTIVKRERCFILEGNPQPMPTPPDRLKCPICKTNTLAQTEVLDNLITHPCAQCKGKWIVREDYWKWIEPRGTILMEVPPGSWADFLPVEQTEKLKICPDCGRFMGKYKVGHGVPFVIGCCGTCAGFWLDANVWENLASRHIHERLHFVISDAWQEKIARPDREKRHEQIVLEKVGAEDLEKIKSIKQWIDHHPRKAELLSVLLEKKER